MPGAGGSASNRLESASSPPADAPSPTTRRSSGRDRGRATPRRGRGKPVAAGSASRIWGSIVMNSGFPHAHSSRTEWAGHSNNTTDHGIRSTVRREERMIVQRYRAWLDFRWPLAMAASPPVDEADCTARPLSAGGSETTYPLRRQATERLAEIGGGTDTPRKKPETARVLWGDCAASGSTRRGEPDPDSSRLG
jgi:hypothetical protein